VVFTQLPELLDKKGTYFLNLTLHDSQHKLVADNFYLLSAQEDQMEWDRYYWFYTPPQRYADFHELNTLPPSQVNVTKKVYKENGEWVVEVDLSNTSRNIAFSLELLLVDTQTENPVLPVYWSDNYVSLVNDDTKTITARCSLNDAISEPSVIIQGINVEQIKK
jgi:exo-1,4-beta-D-glucosaminidase